MSCDISIDPIPNSPECIKSCLNDPDLNCQRMSAGYKIGAKEACATYATEDMPEECCKISSFADEQVQESCAQMCMESDSFSQDACQNVEDKIEEYCGTNLNEKCCTSNFRELQEDECQKVFPINYNFKLECADNGKVKFEPENIDINRGNKIRYLNCEEDPSEQAFGDFDFKCLPDKNLEVTQNNFPDDDNSNKKTIKCINTSNSSDESDTFKVTNNGDEIDIICGNKTHKTTCKNNKTTTTNCGSMFTVGFFVGFFVVLILIAFLFQNKKRRQNGISFGIKI